MKFQYSDELQDLSCASANAKSLLSDLRAHFAVLARGELPTRRSRGIGHMCRPFRRQLLGMARQRARRARRTTIVAMDRLGISEYEIAGGSTVFFFARAYGDDRSSAAAYERGRAKISERDEIGAIAGRFREVAAARASNSTASWGGVGGLGLGPEGSRGSIRRPQG